MKWKGTIVLIGKEDFSKSGPFNIRTGKKTKLAEAIGLQIEPQVPYAKH